MYKKQDMVRDDHSSSIVRIVHDQELQLRLHLKEVDDWNVSYLGRNKVHMYLLTYLYVHNESRSYTIICLLMCM